MKTRNGFVSNSSSSSFVVVFPKELPKTVAEMERLLFGDKLYVGYNNVYSTKEIAFVVMRDMKEGRVKSRKELLDELTNGMLEPSEEAVKHGFTERCLMPDWDFAQDTQNAMQKYLEKRAKCRDDVAKTVFKQLLKVYDFNRFFKFHYSDNDGCELNSFMEHGDIFQELVHFRLNHH
jgi:hypothetical protein